MKTEWTVESAERATGSPNIHEWIQAKLARFQERTGVLWSASYAHGCIEFRPTLDWNGTEAGGTLDECEAVRRQLPYGLHSATMVQIAEQTGIKMPRLAQLLKALIQMKAARFDVDRSGKMVGFRRTAR